MNIRKKTVRWVKNNIIYFCLAGIMRVSCLLPRGLVIRVLGWLGLACYHTIGYARRTTLRNLRQAFGTEKSEAEIKRIARDVFIYAGRNLADIFRLRMIDRFEKLSKIVSSDGFEHLEAAHKKGKGVICITGHMGSFELLAAYVSLKGYPVQVVGTRLYDRRLDELLVKNRQGTGVENIIRGRDTLKIIRHLKRGGVLGILIDQDTKVDSRFVEFFGRPASTPVGAAVLALRTGAAVVALGIRQEADRRHKIVVRPEMEVIRTGDDEADRVRNTQAWTTALEGLIREAPAQWVWMHDRWKRRPKTETGGQ